MLGTKGGSSIGAVSALNPGVIPPTACFCFFKVLLPVYCPGLPAALLSLWSPQKEFKWVSQGTGQEAEFIIEWQETLSRVRTNSGQGDYFRWKLSQDDSGWFLKGIITAVNTLMGENDNDQRDNCANQPVCFYGRYTFRGSFRSRQLFLGDGFLYRWLTGPSGLGLHAMHRGRGNGVSMFFIRKPLG